MGGRGRWGNLSGRLPRGWRTLLGALVGVAALVAFPGLAGADPTQTPDVVTEAASAVTDTGATFNGTVNPWDPDAGADYSFNWGTDTSYSNTPVTGTSPAGTTPQDVSAPMAGLTPGTTYHYQLCATNSLSVSPTCGSDAQFTTPPTATTGAATPSTTSASATLNGTVGASDDSTSWVFDYGTASESSCGAYPGTSTGGSVGSGTTSSPVSDTISGLAANTTYYFRLSVTNAYGTTCSTVEHSFTTPNSPTPVTGGASPVDTQTETLKGTVNPNGATVTQVYFEYGTTSGYGSTTNASPSPGSGTGAVPVSANLSGLASGTQFHYTLCATNTYGNNCDPTDHTFTTESPPTAVLGASPTSGPTPLKVRFDGSGSSDPNPGGSITSWKLAFGDGSTAATGSGAPPSSIPHTYSNPCSCTAKLTVTGSEGASDSDTQVISVSLNQPPVAILSASPNPTSGTMPLDVTFDGSQSYDPDNIPLQSWSLDFGDGSTPASGGPGPVPDSIAHTYTAAGTYQAVLTVTDSSNASTSSTPLTVTVDPLPTIDIGDTSVTASTTTDTNAVFSVTLSAPSTHDIKVDYATADGTATAGTDYTATQGTLTIPAGTSCPGDPACNITVQALPDTIYKPNETFTVNLSNPRGTTIDNGTGTGTIVNTYPPPLLEIENGAGLEGNTGSLVHGAQSWNSGGNLALNDASGFPSTSGPHTFYVSTPGLDSVSQYTYQGVSGNSLTGVSPAGAVAGGQWAFQPRLITLTVLLCNPLLTPPNDTNVEDCVPTTSGADTTVQYKTSDGFSSDTHIPVVVGQDYVYAAGTLTIPAGAASGQISVENIPNTTTENPSNPTEDLTRWFFVNLANATDSTIRWGLGTATIIEDDGLDPPTATTGSASAIGTSSATVACTVNPNGAATDVYVQYGPTDSYGSKTAIQHLPAGDADQDLSFHLTGLSPGTKYRYQCVATHTDNSAGYGQQGTFTTATSPKLSDPSAASAGPTQEKVSVHVDPNGAETKVWVDYGTSTSYGMTSAAQTIPAGPAKTLTFTLTGLKSGTLYHYIVVAQHTTEAGQAATPDRTFTTSVMPMHVSLKHQTVTATNKGVVAFSFKCTGNSRASCKGRALLELPNGTPVGFTSFSVRPNHTKLIHIALVPVATRRLHAKGRLHLYLTISVQTGVIGITDQPTWKVTVRS